MPLQFDPAIITEDDLLTLHDEHTLAEEHLVPGANPDELSTYTIPASGIVALREAPKQTSATVPTGTTVTQVPGGPFTEVLTTPAINQFQVNYAQGTVKFNVGNAGDDVLVSYTARGSLVKAAHINKISEPFVPFYNKLDGIVPDGGTDFTFPGDVTISGELNIIGVVNKVASEVLDLTDDILFLNAGNVDDGTPLSTVGVEIARSASAQGALTHPQLLWVEGDLAWEFLSTSAGPTGTRAPLLSVYDEGGILPTRLTAAQETTLLTSLGAGDGGRMWFNTTTSQFMGWNGTAAVILG